MTINQRLKEVRKALGLTQTNFCRGIHFQSHGYYADIELGNKEVNGRMVELVSSVYGVSKKWLLTGQGAMFDQALDPKLVEMTVLFNELTVNYQDYILTQIKNLIKLQTQEAEAKSGQVFSAPGPTGGTDFAERAP